MGKKINRFPLLRFKMAFFLPAYADVPGEKADTPLTCFIRHLVLNYRGDRYPKEECLLIRL